MNNEKPNEMIILKLPFAGTVDVVSWLMMSVKQELTSF